MTAPCTCGGSQCHGIETIGRAEDLLAWLTPRMLFRVIAMGEEGGFRYETTVAKSAIEVVGLVVDDEARTCDHVGGPVSDDVGCLAG